MPSALLGVRKVLRKGVAQLLPGRGGILVLGDIAAHADHLRECEVGHAFAVGEAAPSVPELVIGEAVDFDAMHLPELPEGWTRDYFLYANGFAKDMDFYAAHGDTVSPLPFPSVGEQCWKSGCGCSSSPTA